MTDIFLAQILILFLHIPVLFRPFSKHTSRSQYKKDVLALIPFVAHVILILCVFAFTLQISFIGLFILNILTCLLNLPRAYSFLSNMHKDYFSIPFKILSALLLVFSLLLLILFSVYRPASNTIIDILINKTVYYGSHTSGFFEHKRLLDSYDAEKIVISQQTVSPEAQKQSPTILAITDFGFTIEDMYETSSALVEKGYTLVLFDFFGSKNPLFPKICQKKSVKNFWEKWLFFFTPQKLDFEKSSLISQKKQELLSAISILYGENPSSFFIIAEGLGFEAAQELEKEYPFVIEGVYNSGIKTFFEKGNSFSFANFLQTKPLDARIFNMKEAISPNSFANQVDTFIQTKQKRIQEEEDDINRI